MPTPRIAFRDYGPAIVCLNRTPQGGYRCLLCLYGQPTQYDEGPTVPASDEPATHLHRLVLPLETGPHGLVVWVPCCEAHLSVTYFRDGSTLAVDERDPWFALHEGRVDLPPY